MRLGGGAAAGYSLVELLIAVAVVGLVAAALLGVHQTSGAAYQSAVALEDAQLRARSALDRMASELRLIGAYWNGATGAGPAISAATATSITFMGDVNRDTLLGTAETTTTATAAAGATTITVSSSPRQTADAFNVYANAALNDFVYIGRGVTRDVRQVAAVADSTLTLTAPLAGSYPAGSLVRSVERVTYVFNPATGGLTRSVGGSGADTVVDRLASLTLTYFDGGHPPTATADLASIREIHVSLTAEGRDGRRRTMTSRVRIRN